MKLVAVILLAVGIAALTDRQANQSRYTDTLLKLSIDIKRSFLGR